MWIWKRRKWWNSKKSLAVFLYSWRHWSTVSPQRRLKGWSLILLEQWLETVFFNEIWEHIRGSKCVAMRVARVRAFSPFLRTLLWSAWKGRTAEGSAETSASPRTSWWKKNKKIQLEMLRWKKGRRADCRVETTESADMCRDVKTLGNLNENLPNLPGLRRLPEGRQYRGWKFLLIFRMTFLMISLNSKE